jgi:hypothetical protein
VAEDEDPERGPLEDISALDPLTANSKTNPPSVPVWTLIPHDKKVLAAWERLSRDTSANIVNAYDWLSQRAMTPRGSRCFALRHAKYLGCWCYELGPGDRLYYKPDADKKIAIVWYVGPHPKDRVPPPPKDI